MLLAALAAQALAPPPAVPSPTRQAEIRRHLDTVLFDGESARFRWLAGSPDYYCGWVNAKNRMGAYVGWRLFLAVSDARGSVDRVMIDTQDEGFESYVTREACRNRGVDLSGPPPT